MPNNGRRLPIRVSAALAGVLALAAVGCGTQEIDGTKVEQLIQQDLERKGVAEGVKSVKCPSGLPSKTGHTFECTLRGTDGSTAPVPARVNDGDKGIVGVGTEARPGGASQSGGANARQAKRKFDSAATKLARSLTRFGSRTKEDAEAGNMAAIDANAGQLRDAYYRFDEKVRKIKMPPSVQNDVNRVLESNGAVIGELDAYAAATSESEKARLLERVSESFEPSGESVDRVSKALARAK